MRLRSVRVCHDWSAGSARISTRGAVATWPARTSATCSWTGGIPRSGSVAGARGSRCWRPGRSRGWAACRAGPTAGRGRKCGELGEVVASLVARHLPRPVLAMMDGNPGLATVLLVHWPGLAIQRCTAHKLRNLQSKAPARLREELTEDYRRMIYADTVSAVEQARTRFTKKWRLRCPAVVDSLEEAGDSLFTFLRFPSSQWRPCAPPTRSNGSTGNSVAARRRRPACPAKSRCCSSCLGCSAAAK